jgi:hypothetical protein
MFFLHLPPSITGPKYTYARKFYFCGTPKELANFVVSYFFKVLIYSFFECVQLLLIALSLVGGEFCVALQLNLQAIYPEQSLLHHLLCLRHLDKKLLSLNGSSGTKPAPSPPFSQTP